MNDTPEVIPITSKFIKDITGQKFGRLLVIGYVGSEKWRSYWLVACECGNSCVAKGHDLIGGSTKSCGCLKKEIVVQRNTSHGMSRTPEYGIWWAILNRCNRPNDLAYDNYGGRGITVCERWRHSFENFIEDMGQRPGPKHSIDRIDNDLGYSPENCRWATRALQANNKRSNRFLEYQGERLTISQWAERVGINQDAIGNRIIRGWSVERALTQPLRVTLPPRKWR